MARTKGEKRYILNANVCEVMKMKQERAKFTFRITPEGTGYLVDGKLISEKEFDAMYPTQLKPSMKKGRNSDRTKNWMFDEKSYN